MSEHLDTTSATRGQSRLCGLPRRFLYAVCGGLMLNLVAARGIAQHKPWVEAKSLHFVVRTDAGPDRAQAIASQLESIRRAYHAAFSGPERDPEEPLLVLALMDEAQFAGLLPPEWAADRVRRPPGLFLRSAGRNFILMRADLRGERSLQLVNHEYFHLFESLNLPRLPVWLSEGLAEFYANTSLDADGVTIGAGALRHKILLRDARLLPMGELLRAKKDSPAYSSPKVAPLFYAQSWALVHLLTVGGKRAGSIPTLLAELRESEGPDEALRAALGDEEALAAELSDYIGRNEYASVHLAGYRAHQQEAYTVRNIGDTERDANFADFLLASGRTADARRLLEPALKAAPRDVALNDAMGLLLFSQGDSENAAKHLAQAIEGGSTNWRVYYTLATLRARAATAREDLAGVERLLHRSVELNGKSAGVLAALAGVVLDQGRDVAEARRLAEEASAIEPQAASHRVLVARALFQAGELAAARTTLQQAMPFAKSSLERKAIADLLRSWEQPRAAPAPVYRSSVLEFVVWEKDSSGEEALRRWKAEREQVAHLQSFVSGNARRVVCTGRAALRVELETETGSVLLAAENRNIVAYYVTRGTPPKQFDPCRGLQGRELEVVYRPRKGGRTAGEILAMEMIN